MAVLLALILSFVAASDSSSTQNFVTLQFCDGSATAEHFTIGGDGAVIDGDGNCASFANNLLSTSPCDSSPDTWIWHADGTVESHLNPGQCWNAMGGAGATNTSIIECESGDLLFKLRSGCSTL
jgi:hypothetical protein